MTLFKIMFNMKLFQWRYGLFLLPVALWLPMGSAQAAPNVTCTASMNTGTVNISDAITPANADRADINGTVNYRCTNSGTAGYVSVCLGVDGGNYNNTIINPRYLTAPNGSKLAFTMTLPKGDLWGPRNGTGSEYNSGPLLIPATSSISGDVAINISLLSGYNNTSATPGLHLNSFNGNHTTLTFETSGDGLPAPNCGTGAQGEDRFPFTVQATVVPSCAVTATSDVNLGSHSASQTGITGSNNNAISVTCTNDASYSIGLTPSNNNTGGAGVMKGTGSNADKVPYQLRSSSGTGGTIWGNTTTATTVGNGLAGIGSGVAQAQTVYVTVPNADFKPGNYSDTVTISVNY